MGAAPGPAQRDFGVALSGGGVRASAFALGALLYLVDSGLNRRVAVVSSVSGASLTNGFVLSRADDFASLDTDQFDQIARELIRRLTATPVMGAATTALYRLLLALALLCGCVALVGWPVDGPPAFRAALPAILGAILLRRARPIEWAIERRYLAAEPAGRAAIGALVATLVVGTAYAAAYHGAEYWPVELSSPPWLVAATVASGLGLILKAVARLVRPAAGGVWLGRKRPEAATSHVFCSTDLVTESPFFFVDHAGGGWVYNRYGWFTTSRVTLATAVRASAALPGAFPPRALRSAWLTRLWERVPQRPPWWFHLSDGGVWDNLGTQWFGGAAPPKDAWNRVRSTLPNAPSIAPHGAHDVRRILVVDGRRWGTGFTRWNAGLRSLILKTPLLSEVVSLLSASAIQYENTVEPRTVGHTQQLRLQMRCAVAGDRLVSVATLTRHPLQPAAGEVEAAVKELGTTLPHHESLIQLHEAMTSVSTDLGAPQPNWLREGRSNQATLGELYLRCAKITTTLGALSTSDVMALVIHGYVQAMGAASTMVAIEGAPTAVTMAFPGIDRFNRLVTLTM